MTTETFPLTLLALTVLTSTAQAKEQPLRLDMYNAVDKVSKGEMPRP
ncbi:hypothetical protein [Dyella tabacisoli]|nr:hypothetical protein [Dyella tabacisoli]